MPLLSIWQFCWTVTVKQNLSNKEKRALHMLIKNQNVKVCVNYSGKNLGPISADTDDVMGRSKKKLIDKIKFDLKNIVWKHMDKGSCSSQEANFLLSRTQSFSIPHFYIIWKILKNPPLEDQQLDSYTCIIFSRSLSKWILCQI